MSFYVGEVPNLYWGNQTKDRPKRLVDESQLTELKRVKVDGSDNYTGLVKLQGKSYNYARLNNDYYFLELQKPFGGGWFLYRLVYDFWSNEVIKNAVVVKGTLSKTTDENLVLQNINYSLPIIENGNKLDYLNLEHDLAGYKPEFNFLASSLVPWEKHLDPNALVRFFLNILYRKAQEAERTGLDRTKLIIPALQFVTYRGKGYIPLLRGLVQHLKQHHANLAIYEVDAITTTTLLAELSGFKPGSEGKYLLIGAQKNLFLGHKRLENKRIVNVDLSGLTDVKFLNPKDLKPAEVPKIKAASFPDAEVIPSSLTRNDLEDFTIVPRNEIQIILDLEGNRIELTHFKLGEIKDYAEKTINGEVKADGILEILTGLKDIKDVNWKVDPTHADFLKKHGQYTPIEVNKGDIIIPLDKYDLIHEKGKDILTTRPPRLHDPREEDLFNAQTLDLEQPEEEPERYRKLLIGDSGFEREALTFRPHYAANGYTLGFMQVHSVALGEYVRFPNRNYVYYARLNRLKRRPSSDVVGNANPEIDKSYTEEEFKERYNYDTLAIRHTRGRKADPLTAWEWFFEDDGWTYKYSTQGKFDLSWVHHSGVGFEGPEEVALPEGAEGVGRKNEDILTKALGQLGDERLGERTFKPREGIAVYQSESPRGLLRRFLQDGENTRETRYKGFVISEESRGESGPYLHIKKIYKGRVFSLVMLHRTFNRTGIKWGNGGGERGRGKFVLGNNFLSEICSWYAGFDLIKDNIELIHGNTDIERFHSVIWKTDTDIYPKTFYYAPSPGEGSHMDRSYFAFMPAYETTQREGGGHSGLREKRGASLLIPSKVPAEILNPLNLDIADVDLPENFPSITDEISGWDASNLETHAGAYFDLVGTNYLLAVKKLNDGSLTYKLILKQPNLSLIDYEIHNFQLNSPINVVSTAQVVNQFNTLYFYGEILPLKFRKRFVNQSKDTFDKFTVTPLNIEGANTAYEYRGVELKTEADDIRKVFTCMKLTKDIQGTYDPVDYERLKVDHEQSKQMRDLRSREIKQQRAEFLANLAMQREEHHWQYYGEGQASWQRARNGNWGTGLVKGGLSVAATAASMYALRGTSGAAKILGITQGLGTGVGAVDTINNLWGEGWHGPAIAREHAKDLEARQMRIKEEHTREGYSLQGERNIQENQRQEINERRNLLQLTSGIQIEPVTDYHTHKALIKLLKIGDIHLITNYPEGGLLERLNEYYDKNGYDLVLPNYTLDLETLKNQTNPIVQFSYIDELTISDPAARKMIENALLNGVRLRD